MKWIARVSVFVAALVLGTFASSLFWYSTLSIVPLAWVKAPVGAERLIGKTEIHHSGGTGLSRHLTDQPTLSQ